MIVSTWDDKPNDYEHAVAIIEQLRAENEQLQEQIKIRSEFGMSKDMQEIMRINNGVRAENEKLREALRWRLDTNEIERLRAKNDRLRVTLQAVVDDVLEYERINNLAPNPGRTHCWDSITKAKEALRG